MGWHFDTKQKSNSYTLWNCVWLCVIFLQLKKMYSFFSEVGDLFFLWFYVITQDIARNSLKNTFGFRAKSSVAGLNICRILMRYLMKVIHLYCVVLASLSTSLMGAIDWLFRHSRTWAWILLVNLWKNVSSCTTNTWEIFNHRSLLQIFFFDICQTELPPTSGV